MKTNKLFEDVFMDIDWSLYDDETADLSGVGDKIYRAVNKAAAKWRPKTKDELIKAIKEELKNGNTDLNCIDTSEITDMSLLFDQSVGPRVGLPLSEEQQKTLDVSDWDVSNVTDMSCMFYGCTDFNQNLSKWDVRNVKDMHWMFDSCKKFNQDLSGWDVRNAKNMSFMFFGCTKLKENGLIPDWYKLKYETE